MLSVEPTFFIRKMATIKEYLLMLWFILFSIVCSIVWVDQTNHAVIYNPDSAAFIISMMFSIVSMFVFMTGLVCLAT